MASDPNQDNRANQLNQTMARTINLAAMTIKTIMQTSTVSEKFDREDDDQGTHEIEDQTNQEMRNYDRRMKMESGHFVVAVVALYADR